MDLTQTLGLGPNGSSPRLTRQVKLHLIANGLAGADVAPEQELSDAQGILQKYREQSRLLISHRCPADERIEAFLKTYLLDVPLEHPLRLPNQTIVLHRHGLARELSLPENGDEFASDLLSSFRLKNGVLHN